MAEDTAVKKQSAKRRERAGSKGHDRPLAIRATAVTTPACRSGESGINEKKLNLIYAKKLQTLLEAKGYRVCADA